MAHTPEPVTRTVLPTGEGRGRRPDAPYTLAVGAPVSVHVALETVTRRPVGMTAVMPAAGAGPASDTTALTFVASGTYHALLEIATPWPARGGDAGAASGASAHSDAHSTVSSTLAHATRG